MVELRLSEESAFGHLAAGSMEDLLFHPERVFGPPERTFGHWRPVVDNGKPVMLCGHKL
jgi:hypothetical protein